MSSGSSRVSQPARAARNLLCLGGMDIEIIIHA